MRRRSIEREIRIRNIGEYIVSNKATVRDTAKAFGVSKSIVHYYITNNLPEIDNNLCKKAKEVLAENKSIRHIRGGEATRKIFAERSCTLGGDTSEQ